MAGPHPKRPSGMTAVDRLRHAAGRAREDVLNGKFDDTASIKVPLAMLKRGRELAGEGK